MQRLPRSSDSLRGPGEYRVRRAMRDGTDLSGARGDAPARTTYGRPRAGAPVALRLVMDCFSVCREPHPCRRGSPF